MYKMINEEISMEQIMECIELEGSRLENTKGTYNLENMNDTKEFYDIAGMKKEEARSHGIYIFENPLNRKNVVIDYSNN